jgi:hypothetical protein
MGRPQKNALRLFGITKSCLFWHGLPPMPRGRDARPQTSVKVPAKTGDMLSLSVHV